MTPKTNEDGVAPVVGVMLMLVVTIIIAAVVATFATGIMPSSASGASEAMIELVGFSDTVNRTVQEVSGSRTYDCPVGDIGFVFKVSGGSVNLDDLRLAIIGSVGSTFSGTGTMMLTADDPVSMMYILPSLGGSGRAVQLRYYVSSDLDLNAGQSRDRMSKYGLGLTAEEKSDRIVESGEMFIVRVEYWSTSSKWIGVRNDREGTNTWASGAISLAEGCAAYVMLSNDKTGVTYVDAMLTEDDII